jgi:hypothetical protein
LEAVIDYVDQFFHQGKGAKLTRLDAEGNPNRHRLNAMFCYFHMEPFLNTHGRVPKQAVSLMVTELMSLDHFAQAVARVKEREQTSQRDAMNTALIRVSEHLNLSGCCLIGDAKMKEIYNGSWNHNGLKLRKPTTEE